MKQFYLFLIFIITTSTVKSQSLVDTTKLWNVAECSTGPFDYYCQTTSYKFQGDTTIGSYTYKKLYSDMDTTLANWFLIGAMRDSGQKVYFNNFANEYLLYNFGANVGDTIEPIAYCLENYLIVDSVDTVIIDGQSKRRLIFNFPGCIYTEEWIEDVGSNHGLLNELILNGSLMFDFGQDLLCYWQNDTVRWINPIYNDCYYVTVGIDEQTNLTPITIFPNPCSDFAIINFPGVKSRWSWRLCNSIGQVVQVIDNIVDSKLTIVNGGLPAGVYTYLIRTEKEFIASGKLIIK